MRITYLFIAIFVIGQSLIAQVNAEGSSYSYSNSEVQEFKNDLSQKIKTNVGEYLGTNTGFSIALQLQTRPSTPVKAAKTVSKDMGYLIVPAVEDAPQNNTKPTVEVQSASVMVFVYSKYPEKILKNIKEVVKGVTDDQSFPVNIKFNYLPTPPPKVTVEEKPADKVAEKPAEKPSDKPSEKSSMPPAPPKTAWDHLRENSLPIAIFLGILFLGAALIIGVIVFAKFFKAAVVAVADSIKDFNKGPAKEDSRAMPEITPMNAEINSASFARNIKIINNIIEKSPYVFSAAINEKHNDYVGLKKLIPNLFSDEGTQAKDLFSDMTITKIEESADVMNTNEFYSWLDHFVERLTLNHLKKGNRFTRLIDRETVNNIYGLESDKLTNYAINKNSGLVFKLVMDFLTPESAKTLFDQLSPSQWELVLDPKNISVENINQAAKELLSDISAMKEQTSADVSSKGALEEVLVAPIASYLYTKSLSEYDEYFNQIVKLSPEISSKIQEKIWSPSLIRRMPTDYLKKKLVNVNLSDREYLLIGFSEDISSLLSQCIPEGKMKQVLLDEFAKSKGKYSKEKLALAETYCKKFLNSLRESCAKGEFILTEERFTESSTFNDESDDNVTDISEAA